MNGETDLCRLARKYGTDKGGWHLTPPHDTCHNYTPTYFHLFRDRTDEIKNVLEIGIADGRSLRMWRDFFPNAMVWGIDLNPACIFTEHRIACYAADQSSKKDLDRVLGDNAPRFDLIVDDGSHEPAHQIFTARFLLPCLTPTGIYVIEDIEPDCQPELIGVPIVKQLPYRWRPIYTGRGLGRAYCRCGCDGGENLIVIRRV
jgi:8-demethyl-8-alpha-L-rhamnosyltetracenomycin-C 2'-O-methyltransferase